ncbi:MAG: hypothetical protein RIS47_267 [Bacteroidota bacterium]|jgi:beta-lactam-binding protein with PASTA domain
MKKEGNFIGFIKSGYLWKHVGIMVITSFVLLSVVFFSINAYTMHGEEFHVPDFRGLTLDEVKKICDDSDLRYEIMDSVYQPRLRKGAVVEQDPPATFLVKKGRRIFLILNSTRPELILMPDVTGVHFSQSWIDLEGHGLRLGKISYAPNMAQNLVLEQRYKGRPIFKGERIEKGAEIELVLGMGEDTDLNRTEVPKLTKLNFNGAQRLLFKSYLNVGAISYDRTVGTYEDSLRAFVCKQSPSPRSNVPFAQNISLWLSLDTTKITKDTEYLPEDISNYDMNPGDSLILETEENVNDN